MIRKNSAARTFLCLLLAFVFAASCLPQTIFATTDKKTVTTWPEGPENNSGAVCLLDADTGAVLYDKNMDEQRYPASITKILTALLIIENKQMTDTVTFGEHAVSESIREMPASTFSLAKRSQWRMLFTRFFLPRQMRSAHSLPSTLPEARKVSPP